MDAMGLVIPRIGVFRIGVVALSRVQYAKDGRKTPSWESYKMDTNPWDPGKWPNINGLLIG